MRLKNVLTVLLCIMTMASTEAQGIKKMPKAASKSLIVYYSRRGNNYVNGKIENLKVGNTEVIAEKLQKMTGADVFRLIPVVDYPADYSKCVDVASEELHKNARPRYKSEVKDMAQYNIIYVGFPNWCGTMPMLVWTFLQSHNLSGKIILPFCTNEGSGLGNSEKDIKKLCPKSILKKGLSIRGSAVQKADADIEKWLKATR